MFSMMSSRRMTGFSEGKDAIPLDPAPQPILMDRLRDDINRAPQDSRQAAAQVGEAPYVGKTTLRRVILQFDQDIHVRTILVITTGYRPEQRQAQNAGRFQLPLMRPNCCNNFVGFGHDRYLQHSTDEPKRLGTTLHYAPRRAFSMKSGRSALAQSGTARIFFSLSRISACSCMYGLTSDGKPGLTSTVASALRKVSWDML